MTILELAVKLLVISVLMLGGGYWWCVSTTRLKSPVADYLTGIVFHTAPVLFYVGAVLLFWAKWPW